MNFFRYFWLSCGGFRTYIPLINVSLKSSLGYWACFSMLIAAGLLLNAARWFNLGFPTIAHEVSKALPAFGISNGVAYSSLPQPYITNTNSFPIILDLKDEIKDPKTTYPRGGMIIKEKDVEIWLDELKVPPRPLKTFPDGEVNGSYLEKLGKEKARELPLYFPTLWLSLVFLGIVQALLFTMFAGFLERSMDPSYNFTQLFNISVFSLSPSSLIIMILMSVGLEVPYSLIYFACYCFFVVMTSGACRASLRPPKPGENQDDEELE